MAIEWVPLAPDAKGVVWSIHTPCSRFEIVKFPVWAGWHYRLRDGGEKRACVGTKEACMAEAERRAGAA